ncbi:proteasome assembly chaperone 2 [Basidiobolus meristosporus CBS 931.73]|uniref:Proteasome assembly chaperone 2 n=1 Tax=Basidiobolus meristosporus CBS 931.73 TaxID=1314790 RepID=A0A1Y1XDN8_9FUNG|nr:proteasome assembly chaperone 2 [Basidiobolus meristosporus CBS 931.73]|eukprot:ORX83859.1 proteasome assembly chaperone 2 [Basidiobolus meristosporus CBS 931.73]
MNTFQPLEKFAFSQLHGSTLLLPSVSIGNVPQLTLDLLISTLGLQKVGFLDDACVHQIAGSNAFGQSTGITVSLEVFQTKDQQWTLVQQRAPAFKKKWHQFARNLVEFIKAAQFKQVILLSGFDSFGRTEVQLQGPPLRYLATPTFPEEIVQRLTQLGIGEFERTHVNRHGEVIHDDEKTPYIPGGGMTKYFLSECQANEIPLMVVLVFSTEGDNIPDGILLANLLNSLFQLLPPEGAQWTPPVSWEHLYGTQTQQILYD